MTYYGSECAFIVAFSHSCCVLLNSSNDVLICVILYGDPDDRCMGPRRPMYGDPDDRCMGPRRPMYGTQTTDVWGPRRPMRVPHWNL